MKSAPCGWSLSALPGTWGLVFCAPSNEDQVESILGLARRLPRLQMRKVEWTAADVTKDDLVPHLRDADAVVLLAWLKQPSRDLNKLWMNNVEGSTRVAGAVKEAGFPCSCTHRR